MNVNFEKHKHYSIELERAILGACMLENTAFGRIFGVVEDETFYNSGHRLVFSCMREMFSQGVPIDVITVVDWVVNKKNKKDILGDEPSYFVTVLTNSVVSTASLEYHSYILKELWQRRRILEIKYSDLKSSGDNPKEDAENINKELNRILSASVKQDWFDMSELMVHLYTHQEEMKQTGGIGIKTGISAIDRENGGFHNGQMIVIGARPSVGKSALAGTIAMSMAKDKKTVGIISLEMSNTEIAARLAAIDTNTDFSVLYRGLYQDELQMQSVYRKIGDHTSTLPIYVSDKTDVNVMEIKAKALKLKSKHGLDCLMIDYLQLINVPENSFRTRENEISKISRACKIMAKEMNIPVVLLCQLNREVTKRKGTDRYPQLSDLRESGSIEQDADVCIFLHSDWMAGFQQDENGESTEGRADLVIRKWRNGKNNYIIPLIMDGPKMKFTERKISSFYAPPTKDFTESDKSEMPF